VCDIIDIVGIGEKLVMWLGFYFLIVCMWVVVIILVVLFYEVCMSLFLL